MKRTDEVFGMSHDILPDSYVDRGALDAELKKCDPPMNIRDAAFAARIFYTTLERLEGNVLGVYRDKLANGIPTFCAGRTDWSAKPGTKLTDDQCREVNKITLLEYGYAVLDCVNWDYLTVKRLIGLIMLMGIATKNSILLVEYAIMARRGHPAQGNQPAVPPMSLPHPAPNKVSPQSNKGADGSAW